MKFPTLAALLESLAPNAAKVLADLEAAALRNPDLAPAFTALEEILKAPLSAEAIGTALAGAPKEVVDWFTQASGPVLGDDSDMA